MSENTKTFIASAVQTFLATFLTVIATTLSNGDIAWTGAFWSAVLISAVRAAIKAVLAKTSMPLLGGKN